MESSAKSKAIASSPRIFWVALVTLIFGAKARNALMPDELAEEIIENLEAGLNSFREVLAGLNKVA